MSYGKSRDKIPPEFNAFLCITLAVLSMPPLYEVLFLFSAPQGHLAEIKRLKPRSTNGCGYRERPSPRFSSWTWPMTRDRNGHSKRGGCGSTTGKANYALPAVEPCSSRQKLTKPCLSL